MFARFRELIQTDLEIAQNRESADMGNRNSRTIRLTESQETPATNVLAIAPDERPAPLHQVILLGYESFTSHD